MQLSRRLRQPVQLGIHGEMVTIGDHLALFYETDAEFEAAFGFVETGLRNGDHCILFGIPEDIDRMVRVLEKGGHAVEALRSAGRLSILHPAATCDDNLAAVSRHFEHVLAGGATLIRFIGNAAVGREGWPSEGEFYKLEAAVSAATIDLPCVAICMFDLRTQSAKTLMHAAIEGHPVTIHRNCVRENPLYVPRSRAM